MENIQYSGCKKRFKKKKKSVYVPETQESSPLTMGLIGLIHQEN